MGSYYFLAILTPPLSLDTRPEFSFQQYQEILELNLSRCDFEKVHYLRFFIDLYNLRSMWRGRPIDPRGNYSEEELLASVGTQTNLPDYVLDFLQLYPEVDERLKAFPALITKYYQEAPSSKFVKQYLAFEHEWRLVSALVRARKMGRDLNQELEFEDRFDPFVAEVLDQVGNSEIVAPEGYEGVMELSKTYQDDPLALFEALSQMRFNKVEELKGKDDFSLEAILGYMVQLLIVEKLMQSRR